MRSLLGRFHRPMSRGLVNNMLTMNNLGDGSTLDLDFTTMGDVLDPRLTFSRSSTATFVNSSGYVEWAGANLQRYSETFATTSSAWYHTAGTISTGTSTAPDGTTNCKKCSEPNTGTSAGYIQLFGTAAGIVQGLSHTISMWVKAGTRSRILFSVDSASKQIGFDVTAGQTTPTPTVVTGSLLGYSQTPYPDNWYLCSFSWLQVNISGSYPGFYTATGTGSTYTNSYPCNGSYIEIFGFQLNPGSTAQTYYPTTTAAYYAPRFDYSPTNIGEPRGLLIEGNVTNFITQSQALSGYAPYGMMAISIDGTVPDPMGGVETKKIAASTSATSVFHGFLRNATNAGAATTVTVSIFAKRNNYKYLNLFDGSSATASTRFNLDTGVTDQTLGSGYVSSKMTPYPNGWYRCEMTANVPANINRSWGFQAVADTATYASTGASYIGTGNINDGIYVIGWQVEAGSGASSYVPTGASQVTRTIDTCTISDANFSSWFVQGAGTLYAVSDVTKANTRNLVARIENTGATNYIEMGLNAVGYSTEAVAYQGASFTSAFTTYTPTLNIAYKSAYTWEAGRLDLAVNGVSPAAAGATLVTDLIRMGIGSSFGATDVWTRNGHIKQLKYYPMVMTDAQLNALTAP